MKISHLLKSSCIAVATLEILSYSFPKNAHAEGGGRRPGGDWGLNRRVKDKVSPPGVHFVGASGQFTNLHAADNNEFRIPVDEFGRLSPISAGQSIRNSAYGTSIKTTAPSF